MKMPNVCRSKIPLVLAVLCCVFNIAKAAAVYATVELVEGTVNIVDIKGESRIAHVNDTIAEGDTIVTGRDGELQAITEDQGLIAVRADTRMKIEAYRANGDKNDKSIISLFSGTYRSVTGWIGKNWPLNYEIRTPSAIIGVRGTDHEPAVITDAGAGTSPAGIPGTYDKVNTGSTFMKNQAGELVVTPSHAGFAPHGGVTSPKALEKVPDFYRPTRNEKRFEEHKESVYKNIDKKRQEKHAEKISDRSASTLHKHPHRYVHVEPK